MQSKLRTTAFVASRANLLMRKPVSMRPPVETLKTHEPPADLDRAVRNLRTVVAAIEELI